MLRKVVQRHPYACAIVLFIAVMTFVKLGATEIVNSYGLAGTLLTIGAVIGIAALMDRSG